MNKRIQWLDAYRGLASLGVVFFHLNEVLPERNSIYLHIVQYGWLGVPIFFFISGYCIRMILNNPTTPLQFFIRRLFRIYPAYLFSIGIVLFVVFLRYFLAGVNDVTVLPSNIKSIFATLTILTKPALDVPTINWVYWSLTYEIVFYCVISLALFFSKLLKEALLLILISISLAFKPEAFHPAFFLEHFGGFMLGYYTYTLLHTNKKNGYLLGLLGIALCIASILENAGSLNRNSGIAYSLSLLFIFLSSIIFNFRPIEFPGIFQRIGVSSYSLYLIHVPIGVYLLARLRTDILLSNTIFHFLADLIITFFLVLISSLIFKYVEGPSHKLGKRVSSGLTSTNIAWKLYKK